MRADTFTQSPYRCRLDWGRRGAREAAERQDILVVEVQIKISSGEMKATSS